MTRKLNGIELTRYDDLFKTDAERETDHQERVQIVPAEQVFPYARQPYSVDRPSADLVRLMDSIERTGIAEPLIVRPRSEGGYEIISGHRRDYCAKVVGLDTRPVIVRNYTAALKRSSNVKTRIRHITSLLLALFLLLSCVACGQTQTEQPEDTGDKGQYMTDPIPEGKPNPVEPQDTAVDTTTTHTCTFSISCETILDNMDKCVESKKSLVPKDGIIFPATEVEFSEGESVFDVLQRVCRDNAIHMESNWTPVYNSAYVEGINNLYEFDVGSLSGWMYNVNGWYPNYGCSRYQVKDGDVVEWRYTCDLGEDLGSGMGG